MLQEVQHRDEPSLLIMQIINNIHYTFNIRGSHTETETLRRSPLSSSSSGEVVLEPQAEAFQLLSTSVVETPTDGR